MQACKALKYLPWDALVVLRLLVVILRKKSLTVVSRRKESLVRPEQWETHHC